VSPSSPVSERIGMAALEGLRVVDLTRYLSGPTATMLLADLGADVIKVETLPTGDAARQSGPFQDGESVYYMASNRNKRSIAINVRTERGRQIVQDLAGSADVFVQNFRPGTAQRMGLGSQELLSRNPRLIYVSITGFGSTPPGSELPGFDQTAQAMSGLMSVTGTEGTGPLRAGIAVADSTTGVFAALGALAALHERDRTGRGGVVESSLMESMLTLMSYQAQRYLSLGEIAPRVGNDHPIMFPQGTFAARDGMLTLACGNEKMWHQLCQALGVPGLAAEPDYHDNASRMANRAQLREVLEKILVTRSVDDWIAEINSAGIPCGPVLDLQQALTHPVTESLRMVESVRHSRLGDLKVLGQGVKVHGSEQDWLRRHPPVLGEHTVEVLTEMGYSPEKIEQILADMIVLQSSGSDGRA
jgi:crotonobetainyl-CoA:carnitine CoA-transferase CaiB-like acyl-CoA transferase